MRRTSAVLASIHAVEPVSIFNQVSFTCLAHRLASADFVGCADGFRLRENKEPYVSSVFRGAEDASGSSASTRGRGDLSAGCAPRSERALPARPPAAVPS